MHPFLDLGFRTLPLYAIMAFIGALAAGVFAWRQVNGPRLTAYRLSQVELVETMLFGALGAVVGSHLLYGFLAFLLPESGGGVNVKEMLLKIKSSRETENFGNTLKIVLEMLSAIFGGGVFYGGLFGGLFGGWLFLRKEGIRKEVYKDLAACFIPLFHSFARVGCFFAGCCYGIEVRHGFAAEAWGGVSRFPVQLLESGLDLLLFMTMNVMFRRKYPLPEMADDIAAAGKTAPSLLNIYLLIYALIRFLDEFLRGDIQRGFFGPFSTSQWISLVLLLVLMLEQIQRGRRSRRADGRV